MEAAGWISLTVAAIGVLGAFVAALLQLKRDGKSIDRIDSSTAEIKPTVQTIQKVSEKTQELLIGQISALFAENARLNERAKILHAENLLLKQANQSLKTKILSYEKGGQPSWEQSDMTACEYEP